MKASIENAKHNCGINGRESYKVLHVLAIVENALEGEPQTVSEVIRAEFSASPRKGAQNVYCNVFVYGHGSGSGKAGGWGYHKESAALESALESAGIKLSERIGGAGNSAMEKALRAVAESAGYKSVSIIY